jgi:proteasome beta subunit
MDSTKHVEDARQTGTTTVGLVCKDGIVLASDRRATMGYFIASKDIDKIYKLTDRIAMTIAGGVGDAQTLVRWMTAELKLYELKHEKPASVEAAATLLANILTQYKFFPFYVQLIIGGIDEKPRLFAVDMLGGITEEKVTSTGSGSPVAYGVLEELYAQDKDIEFNLPVAAKAVSAAMRRDAASGERVDVVVVSKSGFRRLDRQDVAKLLNA